MERKDIVIPTYTYDNIEELNLSEKKLVNFAREAVKNAYAPYSKFNVGAAVLLENGEIVTGTNQENAAYPSGLCAERVAVFYANSKFPDVPVISIAVAVFRGNDFIEKPVPPCGSCRQVIIETETRFKKPIKIIMSGKEKIIVVEKAQSLLPLHFDDNFLK